MSDYSDLEKRVAEAIAAYGDEEWDELSERSQANAIKAALPEVRIVLAVVTEAVREMRLPEVGDKMTMDDVTFISRHFRGYNGAIADVRALLDYEDVKS